MSLLPEDFFSIAAVSESVKDETLFVATMIINAWKHDKNMNASAQATFAYVILPGSVCVFYFDFSCTDSCFKGAIDNKTALVQIKSRGHMMSPSHNKSQIMRFRNSRYHKKMCLRTPAWLGSFKDYTVTKLLKKLIIYITLIYCSWTRTGKIKSFTYLFLLSILLAQIRFNMLKRVLFRVAWNAKYDTPG